MLFDRMKSDGRQAANTRSRHAKHCTYCRKATRWPEKVSSYCTSIKRHKQYGTGLSVYSTGADMRHSSAVWRGILIPIFGSEACGQNVTNLHRLAFIITISVAFLMNTGLGFSITRHDDEFLMKLKPIISVNGNEVIRL